jgi:beta-galactosidase GanA
MQFYIPWNFHEPLPGLFDWAGQRNVTGFIQLASSLGLRVLVRPGPFICAEWEFGGLPAWLLDTRVTGAVIVPCDEPLCSPATTS